MDWDNLADVRIHARAAEARIVELEKGLVALREDVERSQCRANEEIGRRQQAQIYASRCQDATARMAMQMTELQAELATLRTRVHDVAVRMDSYKGLEDYVTGMWAHELAEAIATKAATGEAISLWLCGCGHSNGANLAHCACCGRSPKERP